MALVRVYCGLASAYPPRRLAVGSSSLTATIVDDAGRILDVCEIGDDSYGYAYLSASLAERASGPYTVAMAADNDQQLVTKLLVAAGWALAVVDNEAADDFADRYSDDRSGENGSAPTRRRALGLARALQAGALSAGLLPPPPELAEVRPVLAAHNAMATGRQAAAVALREVLRELYPAALRAYPDPADPVALAVMDVLPEPGMLSSAARSRDSNAVVDSVTRQLSSAGIADHAAVTEAITALRVAVAEAPRRGGVSKALTPAVAETVRHAVGAVRACDVASTALVNALAERTGELGTDNGAAASAHPASPAGTAAAAPAPPDAHPAGSASPAAPEAATGAHSPAAAHASAAPSHSAAGAGGGAPASQVASPSRSGSRRSGVVPLVPGQRSAARQAATAAQQSAPEPAESPDNGHWQAPAQPTLPATAPEQQPAAQHQQPGSGPPASGPAAANPSRGADPSRVAARRRGAEADYPAGQPHNRPVSPPPPPPPGITPIREPQQPAPPARAAGAEAGRAGGPGASGGAGGWSERRSPDASSGQRWASGQRPAPDHRPPGSRTSWPTNPPADEWAAPSYPGAAETGDPLGAGYAGPEPAAYAGNGESAAGGPYGSGRWTPSRDGAGAPWQEERGDQPDRLYSGDPLGSAGPPAPAEQPALRLVEPTLPEELRDDLGYGSSPPASGAGAPPLRLVEPSSGGGVPRSVPPVSADDDDNLLIFAQTRSAWFDHDSSAGWNSAMDLGWQAAEQASQPTVGDRTDAGLPRRVPHANLVPGAPPRREERPLRVVRDPASIAAHTSGYFSGWRRGQEVGGFPLGNRPARRAAGAWEFHRDEDRLSG